MLMGIVPDKNKTYKSTFSFLTNQLDYLVYFNSFIFYFNEIKLALVQRMTKLQHVKIRQ